MRKRFFVEGLLAGAAAAYFYDPERGRARREQFSNQFWDTLQGMSQAAVDTVDLAKREVTDRVESLRAEAHGLLEPGKGRPARPKSSRVSLSDDWFEDRWQPETRLLAGSMGLLLVAYCRIWRTLSSRLWGTLGFGLIARAVTNQRIVELLGLSSLTSGEDNGTASPARSRPRAASKPPAPRSSAK